MATKDNKEVRPRTLRDHMVEVLQDSIISGGYQPGQRLVEKEFVERFGVSSIPVREALQELENRGLVVRRPNRGCSVVQMSEGERRKAFAVRRLLEPDVVGWAGANAKPEHAQPLRKQMAALRGAGERNDIPDFFRQDMLLHRLIWGMADNPYASRALETILGALFATGLMATKAAKRLSLLDEVAKHEKLVAALIRGDGDGARQILLTIADTWEDTTTALLHPHPG